MYAADPSLRIEGEVAATAGGLSTRLQGHGDRLLWWVSDLRSLRRSIPPVDRARMRHVADRMDRLGLILSLDDPGGRLLELGAVRPSLLNRMVLGTSRARIRRPVAWWRSRG